MFGFIKNIFSGILSFFVGLFGGKKSPEKLASGNAKKRKGNGYFLELDEAEETKLVTASKQAKAAVVEGSKQAKEAVVEGSKQAKEAVAGLFSSEENKPAKEATKTPEPVAAAQPAKAKPAKSQKKDENGKPAKVELVQTAEGLKAEPAKPAASSAKASTNGQNQTETTFAPKYLNPASSSNSRRRPGPSMSPFLDMARQVKTSS